MSLPRPLIERYARHLVEVAAQIAALQAAAGAESCEPLRVIAHKLAGTAEAYGFPIVGDRARQAEAHIIDDRRWTPAVADAAQALREALETAGAEPL